MKPEDIAALNACKVGDVVTLSDGSRIEKVDGRGRSCSDCVVDDCDLVDCHGCVFVEVPNDQ